MLTLWVGGTANRNREAFNEKFQDVTDEIAKELKPSTEPIVADQALASVR